MPLHGFVEQRMSLMGWLFGGVPTEAFSRSFQAAVSDPAVKAIVLDVDSPGGTYPGIPDQKNQDQDF